MSALLELIRGGKRERIGSPFWVAFFASWAVLNYRFVLVVFSSERVANKFSIIDGLYESLLDVAVGFLVPVLVAFFYVLVWPRLDKFIFSAWGRLQLALIEKKIEIDNETPLRGDEARALRNRAAEMEAKHDAAISRKESENRRINEELDKAKKDFDSLSSRLSSWFNMGERNSTNDEIMKALIACPYRLYFNPENGISGSKIIRFERDGEISEGRNNNEYKWNVSNSSLEIIKKDGRLHSKFYYFEHKKIFMTRPEDETETSYTQYMVVAGNL